MTVTPQTTASLKRIPAGFCTFNSKGRSTGRYCVSITLATWSKDGPLDLTGGSRELKTVNPFLFVRRMSGGKARRRFGAPSLPSLPGGIDTRTGGHAQIFAMAQAIIGTCSSHPPCRVTSAPIRSMSSSTEHPPAKGVQAISITVPVPIRVPSPPGRGGTASLNRHIDVLSSLKKSWAGFLSINSPATKRALLWGGVRGGERMFPFAL